MGKKRLPEVLEEEELKALLEAPSGRSVIGVRNRAILALMGRCGLRVSEACGLKTSDIHLEAKDPYVRVIGKGDRERRAWLGNGVRDLIALWLEKRPKGKKALFPVIQGGKRNFTHKNGSGGQAEPGRAVSPSSVRNMVKHFARKAGIERRVHPHMLRHTAATLALRKGENLRNLQEFLGHSNLSTTQVYTHVAGTEMAEMAKRLDPGDEENGNGEAKELAQRIKKLPPEARKALADLLGGTE